MRNLDQIWYRAQAHNIVLRHPSGLSMVLLSRRGLTRWLGAGMNDGNPEEPSGYMLAKLDGEAIDPIDPMPVQLNGVNKLSDLHRDLNAREYPIHGWTFYGGSDPFGFVHFTEGGSGAWTVGVCDGPAHTMEAVMEWDNSAQEYTHASRSVTVAPAFELLLRGADGLPENTREAFRRWAGDGYPGAKRRTYDAWSGEWS